MSDLISRQAAIDAILAVTGNSSVRELYEHVQEHGLSDMWSGGVNAAIDIIIAVPPAQPEQRVEELLPDGTLHLFTDTDLSKVNRVWVSQNNTHYGDLYYADEDPKRGKWIPCSERLPEEYGNYLISIDGKEPDIGTINPNDPRGWSLCDANGFYWASDKALNITAWMPLPEPYKERREDGKNT